MKKILLLVLGLTLSMSVLAQGRGPAAVRKQIEASMLVTGVIVVDEQGKVSSHAVDQPEKITKPLLDFVNTNIANWQFDPTVVDGKAVSARNKWSLRLVAKKDVEDPEKMSVRIAGVSFDPFEVQQGSEVSSTAKGLKPPRYPQGAARVGVRGTVYLLLKVNRDGSVAEVATEQVNMKFVAGENEMQKWRNLLAKTATGVAKTWSFAPPSTGSQIDEPFWVVRVPVDFDFPGEQRGYGQWEAYVPGPRQANPWSDNHDAPGFSPDAMVAGGAQTVGREGGLKLRTPLQGG